MIFKTYCRNILIVINIIGKDERCALYAKQDGVPAESSRGVVKSKRKFLQNAQASF